MNRVCENQLEVAAERILALASEVDFALALDFALRWLETREAVRGRPSERRGARGGRDGVAADGRRGGRRPS